MSKGDFKTLHEVIRNMSDDQIHKWLREDWPNDVGKILISEKFKKIINEQRQENFENLWLGKWENKPTNTTIEYIEDSVPFDETDYKKMKERFDITDALSTIGLIDLIVGDEPNRLTINFNPNWKYPNKEIDIEIRGINAYRFESLIDKQMCINSGLFWIVEYWPESPDEFISTFGSTLDKALMRMLQILREKSEAFRKRSKPRK